MVEDVLNKYKDQIKEEEANENGTAPFEGFQEPNSRRGDESDPDN